MTRFFSCRLSWQNSTGLSCSGVKILDRNSAGRVWSREPSRTLILLGLTGLAFRSMVSPVVVSMMISPSSAPW